VNQTPSVLGSRKAEEFNLEFFDNGGVPPVMILLQGGTLQAETRKAIEQMSTGEARRNNRMRVLEVEPSAAPWRTRRRRASPSNASGSERQADSMFREIRREVRASRPPFLPPAADLRWSGWRLFVRDRLRQLHGGRSAGVQAERDEFDE